MMLEKLICSTEGGCGCSGSGGTLTTGWVLSIWSASHSRRLLRSLGLIFLNDTKQFHDVRKADMFD